MKRMTALEPQLGDDECEFLAAACAREKEVLNVHVQTDASGSTGRVSMITASSRRAHVSSYCRPWHRMRPSLRGS